MDSAIKRLSKDKIRELSEQLSTMRKNIFFSLQFWNVTLQKINQKSIELSLHLQVCSIKRKI
jgi:hypothetical protein